MMERYDYTTVSHVTAIAFNQPPASLETLLAELGQTRQVLQHEGRSAMSTALTRFGKHAALDIRWRVDVRLELWDDAHAFGMEALLVGMTSMIPYVSYWRVLFAGECPIMIHPASAAAGEIRFHLRQVLRQLILERWSDLHPEHGLAAGGPDRSSSPIHRGASPAAGLSAATGYSKIGAEQAPARLIASGSEGMTE